MIQILERSLLSIVKEGLEHRESVDREGIWGAWKWNTNTSRGSAMCQIQC